MKSYYFVLVELAEKEGVNLGAIAMAFEGYILSKYVSDNDFGMTFTVPFEDKRTTQRVPHAEPTRWRFELNAFAFACPRKRKRV